MSYVLVDCNNFYVSCERVFNPKLEKKAVIILSNNDGIIVARSQEAKKLGIALGEPFFKVRDFCMLHKVIHYSSNYQLYGDFSNRIMKMLGDLAPKIQVYSIDEAFLFFSKEAEPKNLVQYCKAVRNRIKRWIGIPVSMGIGPSKTLAKVANKIAKKNDAGVFDIRSSEVQQEVLPRLPVGDIWGIGRNWNEKLHGLGVYTAEEFRSMNPVFVRKQMGVGGERICRELQGISCFSLDETVESSKSIICSRSFSAAVMDLSYLLEAISTYAALACEKLRSQQLCASAVTVWTEALFCAKNGKRLGFSGTSSFINPTQDTPQVITSAKNIVRELFKEGKRYKKCGIILLDLIPEKNVVPDFFLERENPKKARALKTIDFLNEKLGRDTIFYASMGIDRPWKMRCENRTKRYTTCWNELALVN